MTTDVNSPIFRNTVRNKIQELLDKLYGPNQRNGTDIENAIYQKMSSTGEINTNTYVNQVKHLITNLNTRLQQQHTAFNNRQPQQQQQLQVINQSQQQLQHQQAHQQPQQIPHNQHVNIINNHRMPAYTGRSNQAPAVPFKSYSSTQPRNPVPSPNQNHAVAFSPSPAPHNQQPSPNPAHMTPSPAQPSPRSNYSVPSPSAGPINTPAQPGSSPANEKMLVAAKQKELQIYIEPVNRMITKLQEDPSKTVELQKLKKLRDFVIDDKTPLQTLIKCEEVLNRLHLVQAPVEVMEANSTSASIFNKKETHIGEHLIAVLSKTPKRPRMMQLFPESLIGFKQPQKSSNVVLQLPPNNIQGNIPDIIKGEINRLPIRFQAKLDQDKHSTGLDVHIIVDLISSDLPAIPPIYISIPKNYNIGLPSYLISHYTGNDFLEAICETLEKRMTFLETPFSFTEILNCWEFATRFVVSNSY